MTDPESKFRLPAGFWRLFIALALLNLLGAMDISIVATALPVVVGEFHQTQNMSFVIVGYSLAVALMVPVYGKLADKYGSSRLFGWVVAVFLGASIACGLAVDILSLTLARVLQGFAGAGLGILPLAMLSGLLPERVRPKYLAPLASVWAVAAIGGPVLGGILTDTLGWRWIFFINVPIGIVALILAAGALPKQEKLHTNRLFDVWTWVLFAATSVLLVTTMRGFAESIQNGLSQGTLELALGTVLVAGLFVWRSVKSNDPVLPLKIFANRGAATILVIGTLGSTNLFGISSFVPSALQMGFNIPASLAGLGLVPMVLVMVATSIVTSRRIAKTGKWRHLPIIGTSIGTASMTAAYLFSSSAGPWFIVVCLAISAFGLGLIGQLPLILVQAFTKAKVFGAVTATVNVSRDLTGSVVSTIAGGVFGWGVVNALTKLNLPEGWNPAALTPLQLSHLDLTTRAAVNSAYVESFQPIFLNSALAYGFALLLALTMPKLQLNHAAH